MTREQLSRRATRVAVACVFVLLVSACSSSTKGSSPSTAPNSAPAGTSSPALVQTGAARITSFLVPASVQCGATSKTTVRIGYAVAHAARAEIAVDGLDVSGVDSSSGAVTAPVHCDGVPHTVALIAFDAAGARTSQVKYLTTLLPG